MEKFDERVGGADALSPSAGAARRKYLPLWLSHNSRAREDQI